MPSATPRRPRRQLRDAHALSELPAGRQHDHELVIAPTVILTEANGIVPERLEDVDVFTAERLHG